MLHRARVRLLRQRATRATHRRALTLIELLIVIGLIAAILGLVLPFGASLLGRRSLDASVERAAAQFLLARSRAMRDGRAIEILLVPDPPRMLARWFPPDESTGVSAGVSGRERNEDPLMLDAEIVEIPPESLVPASWAISPLNDGVVLIQLRDEALVEDGFGGGLADGFDGDAFDDEFEGDAIDPADPFDADRRANDELAESETWRDLAYEPMLIDTPRRIAILLPDGRAIAPARLHLADERARMSTITIDPWSGRARSTPIAAVPTLRAYLEPPEDWSDDSRDDRDERGDRNDQDDRFDQADLERDAASDAADRPGGAP